MKIGRIYRKLSLKYRIMIAVLCVLIPVSVVFANIANKFVQRIENQLIQANTNSMQVYYNIISTEIQRSEVYLIDRVWNNDKFDLFASSDEYDMAEKTSMEMLQEIKDFFYTNNDITGFVLYNKNHDIFQAIYNQIVGYGDIMNDINSGIYDVLKSEDNTPIGWFLMNTANRWMLCRIMENQGSYGVCMIDLTQASKNANLYHGIDGKVFFYKNDSILNNEDWITRNKINLKYFGEESYINNGKKDYIVIQKQLVGIKVAVVFDYEKSNAGIGMIYSSAFIYFLVAILSLIAVVLYLEKELFKPLNDMVKTMKKVQKGDLTARLSKYKGIEFTQVHDTFNHMMDEVYDLRIKSYEQQLLSNKLELDALRLQIRPHFYLNSLKSIFGLSQAGKMEQIQRTVLYLSLHLRYVFDIKTEVIPLEKELQMIENYISLQKVCEIGMPQFEYSIEDNLKIIKVPPVSLLSLVENSMKHGMSQDGSLNITIHIKSMMIDNQKIIDIIVADNGPGFSQELLDTLNRGDAVDLEGYNIGLANVIRRFHVLYGGDCNFLFSNKNGAQIEIMFSIKEEDIL